MVFLLYRLRCQASFTRLNGNTFINGAGMHMLAWSHHTHCLFLSATSSTSYGLFMEIGHLYSRRLTALSWQHFEQNETLVWCELPSHACLHCQFIFTPAAPTLQENDFVLRTAPMLCNVTDSARSGFTESSDTKANMPPISSLSL